MAKPVFLGDSANSGWVCVAYDLQYAYGYDAMLRILDSIVDSLRLVPDRVWRAGVAGGERVVAWVNGAKVFPGKFEDLKELEEECGEVALASFSKHSTDSLPILSTVMNQMSVITFQVPEPLYTDRVKALFEEAAEAAQAVLLKS